MTTNFSVEEYWKLSYLFTINGAESFHTILWILKDLSWSQNWYWSSMIFGSAAISWLVVLFFHAFSSGSFAEVYMLFATTLWLTANFIWMDEEVTYQTDDIVTPKTEKMMLAAVVYMLVYYMVLRPMNILTFEHFGGGPVYEDAELVPRFSNYFRTWREYEHIHMLFWLLKDVSWMVGSPYTWVISLTCAVILSVDFIYTTYATKRLVWRCAHYTAQLIWILGNGVWAFGELFSVSGENYSHPYSMWKFNHVTVDSTRWWSSWIFLLALLPLLAVWASLTGHRPPPAAGYHVISSNNDDDDSENVIGEEDSNTVQPPYNSKDSLPYGTFR